MLGQRRKRWANIIKKIRMNFQSEVGARDVESGGSFKNDDFELCRCRKQFVIHIIYLTHHVFVYRVVHNKTAMIQNL